MCLNTAKSQKTKQVEKEGVNIKVDQMMMMNRITVTGGFSGKVLEADKSNQRFDGERFVAQIGQWCCAKWTASTASQVYSFLNVAISE